MIFKLEVEGTLVVTEEDMEEGEWNVEQVAQNLLGGMGFSVIGAWRTDD